MRRALALFVVLAIALSVSTARAAPRIAVGSKAFAESWILGDALALLAGASADVEHRKSLGGTEIAYQALRTGAIDVYPEYTGTIGEVILASPDRPSTEEMRQRLATDGVLMSDPLGFNDGYAIAVTVATATSRGLRTLSDLARHPELKMGFSHEFLGRADGWPGLSRRYGMTNGEVRGIQHELAYEALATGKIDATDIYTTDAQISALSLVLLADDRAFFRRYDAVLLYRADLPARASDAFHAMERLVGAVDDARMMRANARVVLDKVGSLQAAEELVSPILGTGSRLESRSVAREIAVNVWRHLELVGLSLFAAILVGVPLGILATRARILSAVTLSGAAIVQTIPSLALLAFLIPLLGIGAVPALVALFLYSLLPIVESTYVGLTSIPRELLDASEALGLTRRAQLLKVALPMASPAILSGIKTSAVINVGTATIAALVGAEGLGKPILEGIALRDTRQILQGALPAALLSLGVRWGFSLVEKIVVPPGLRLRHPDG